jgi:hypothetical protein
MKNRKMIDIDNYLLPLWCQDTKREKTRGSVGAMRTTRHPPSPHCHWRPPPSHHHRQRQEHERVPCQKRPTQQESMRHRGHQREGRWARPGTQEAAHPIDCG